MSGIFGALYKKVRQDQKKNWTKSDDHPALSKPGACESKQALTEANDPAAASKGDINADTGLPEGVLKQGWLRKSGMLNAGLKDRFFRLHKEGKLFYYKDEKQETPHSGYLELTKCKINLEANTRHIGREKIDNDIFFRLKFRWKGFQDREMHLQAESMQSRDNWVKAIMGCPGGSPEKSAELLRKERQEKERIARAKAAAEFREAKIKELGSEDAYNRWNNEQIALRRKREAEERERREKERKEQEERRKNMSLKELAGSAGSGSASDKDKAKAWSHRLYGKIKVVDHFPDVKVQVVNHFADIHVEEVEHFPDKPGKWKRVEHFPDFKVQFVRHFPDVTIKFVNHFPGSQHK